MQGPETVDILHGLKAGVSVPGKRRENHSVCDRGKVAENPALRHCLAGYTNFRQAMIQRVGSLMESMLVEDYLLPRMASLAALAIRNLTTRLAGILISSPV